MHLEIEKACKSFGALKALDGVSLAVPRGSFLTLLGPSGCGKTTLLRSIAGLHSLDSGDIRVDGNGLGAGGPKAVMVFQDYALFPHMSVFGNVSYGLKLRRMGPEAIAKKVDDVLGYSGIRGLEARLPSQLSGGQQQRVALARALVMEPEVLLLDEPLSNLDAKLRLGIRSELKRIQKDLGVTTVYVTHDQGEALALSDVVAVMNHGRLIQMGSPRDIYFHPADEFVADFIGTANFLDALVLEAGGGRLTVSFLGKPRTLEAGQSTCRVGESVTLCVRPESLKILERESPSSVSGAVVESMFEGNHVRYWIDVGGTTLIADDHEIGREVRIGSRVSVDIVPDGLHLIAKKTPREDGSRTAVEGTIHG